MEEQVRVLRHVLEARLGINARGRRPLIAVLAEHAADILSKYEVSADGRASCDVVLGKPCNHEAVEFGEKTTSSIRRVSGGRGTRWEGSVEKDAFPEHTGGQGMRLWGLPGG